MERRDDTGADFYITLLAASLSGTTVPTGREGFFVVETSEHTSREVSTIIAQTLKELGKLPSGEIRAVGENESATLKFMVRLSTATQYPLFIEHYLDLIHVRQRSLSRRACERNWMEAAI